MEWKKTRIGDCILCNPTVKLERGTEYPIIDIDKITVGRKFATNEETLIYSGQSGCKFQKGDTLMARITPCLENGKVAQANIEDKGIGSTELFVFRGMEKVTDNDFVYYFIKQQYIRDLAANSMSGASGRQRADLIFIKKIQFDLPPLPVQQKIASILSTYDNLIENNTKRIRLLERMAENLYKEWFVRFRFPGHENVEFENGLPKGWKVERANDTFNITIGRTPSRKIFDYFSTNKENNHSWISISDMKNGMFVMDTSEYLTDEALKVSNMPMVKPNTVMLSFKLTIGKVAISIEGTCTNEAIAHFNTNKEDIREYTYLYLENFSYNKLGNTSAIGNAINSTIVKNMPFVLPKEDVLMAFNKKVKPMFDEILNLTKQNQLLTRQRDLLLPRLMSGKLEVKI